MPDVSVIVPAHDAAATVGATLDALAGQAFAGTYEVIVVDDGSRDATGAIAQRAGARVVRHDIAAGPAAARNSGRRAAGGRLLAFTDADCAPAPDWLARGADAARDADLVQGSVAPPPGVGVGPFDRTLWVFAESPRLYETANLFVTPELFDRVGGFRAFTAPGPGLRPAVGTEHFGEDILFGWAARRLGARVTFHAPAVVHHAVFRRGPRGYIRERWRLRYFPAIVREVPELRGGFVAGLFLSPRSAKFDLALAGVAAAAATRRPAPLAAVLPYAATLRRTQLWRRSAWRENLARVSADAVGAAALAAGSVAARTPVL